MKLFDYIMYSVFEYFQKKDILLAKSRTVNFMVIFEASFLVPVYLISNGFFHFYVTPENPDPRMKYYVGIPIAFGLMVANSWYLKKRLTNDGLVELHTRFSKNKQIIPIWLIFILPIIFIFVAPLIYGSINGTLSFPLFEKSM